MSNARNIASGAKFVDTAGDIMTGNLGVNGYIDLNTSGNRAKLGYDSNNVYIGSTSGTGALHFKNNIGSTDAPHSSGDTKMIISDNAVTMPNQPAFMAYHYSYDVTYSPNSTLAFPFTLLNRGNHYNTSNSTFTAPVDGDYLFSCNANAYYSSSLSDVPRAYWKVNGANIGNSIHLRGSDATNDGLEQRSQTVLLNLSANDTVRVVVNVNRWDIFGANSFMGYLLG